MHPNNNNKIEVVRSLQKIGVNTRFVSITDDRIFINNLRYSRFSRKKEELFCKSHPRFTVSRSKIFQKICKRVSRVLKDSFTPKEKVMVVQDGSCTEEILYLVLEPYTRKYGVEVICVSRTEDLDVLEFIEGYEFDIIALPFTLDDEAENILIKMLDGEKMELISSKKSYNHSRIIYPLINVPSSWIYSWADSEGLECIQDERDGLSHEMLEFLSGHVPDVREKIYKSAVYVHDLKYNKV